MKEMNLSEAQLRSWKPRHPSARLKRRLFPRAGMHGAAWILGWLAPATASLLLAVTVFNQGNGVPAGPPHHEAMIAMLLSNQSCAAYVSSLGEQNAPHPDTFEWTNRSGSAFTLGFRSSTNSTD